MSISRRSDGRYIVKYKDRTKWKQKTFRAREDAEGFERSLDYDEVENTRLTVSESILLFLSKTKHCPDVERYYAMILRRMGDELGSRYVDTLDRRDLETFRNTMRKEWHASNISINMYVAKLLTAWRWCASEDFLNETGSTAKKTHRWLTDPATDAQKDILSRWQVSTPGSKYDAACYMNFFFHQREIERIIGVRR